MERPRTPHWARRESRLTHTSSSQISPASSGSSSPRRFSRVDLPQPDGPATATNSPAFTSRSTPRSTGTGRPSGPRNVLVSPRARTTTQAPPSGPAPDGLGGRQAHDPERGVGGREPAQDASRKRARSRAGAARRERAAGPSPRASTSVPTARARPTPSSPPEMDTPEGLAQDLAQELPVGGPEGPLDAEVADALEDRRGHRVGERQPADDEAERADAEEQRREERGGLPQQAAQLARGWSR